MDQPPSAPQAALAARPAHHPSKACSRGPSTPAPYPAAPYVGKDRGRSWVAPRPNTQGRSASSCSPFFRFGGRGWRRPDLGNAHKVTLALVAVLIPWALIGCQTPVTQEQSGTIVGGVLGGIIGSQVGEGRGRTAATVIGTLVGAAIGGNVGRSMDETDKLRTAQALETLPTGKTSSWRNPDSGNTYTVTPTRTVSSNEGPCREYTTTAVIGGKTEKIYGRACRQADGSWRVVQ